jgi:hypothetical protein
MAAASSSASTKNRLAKEGKDKSTAGGNGAPTNTPSEASLTASANLASHELKKQLDTMRIAKEQSEIKVNIGP